jgi:hypothetical protein
MRKRRLERLAEARRVYRAHLHELGHQKLSNADAKRWILVDVEQDRNATKYRARQSVEVAVGLESAPIEDICERIKGVHGVLCRLAFRSFPVYLKDVQTLLQLLAVASLKRRLCNFYKEFVKVHGPLFVDENGGSKTPTLDELVIAHGDLMKSEYKAALCSFLARQIVCSADTLSVSQTHFLASECTREDIEMHRLNWAYCNSDTLWETMHVLSE